MSNQSVDDPAKAAADQFEKLGMTATAERNGVLIYVAPRSQKFAIIGDSGIHQSCGQPFWQDVAAAMEADFRAGRFTDGIVKGLARTAEVLGTHFPRREGNQKKRSFSFRASDMSPSTLIRPIMNAVIGFPPCSSFMKTSSFMRIVQSAAS